MQIPMSDVIPGRDIVPIRIIENDRLLFGPGYWFKNSTPIIQRELDYENLFYKVPEIQAEVVVQCFEEFKDLDILLTINPDPLDNWIGAHRTEANNDLKDLEAALDWCTDQGLLFNYWIEDDFILLQYNNCLLAAQEVV
jgi:hypothetical protein